MTDHRHREAQHALDSMSRLLDRHDNSQIISNYNPYDVPGNLEDAERYQKANCFGERDPKKSNEQAYVTSCNKYEKSEQGLCDSKYRETLGKFGAGYSMYFAMFIFTIVILCCPLGIAASLYMYKNSQGTDCHTATQRTARQEYVRRNLIRKWGPTVATEPKIPKGKNLFLFEQNSALFNEHRTNDDFNDNRRRLLKKVLVEKSQINKQNKSRTRNLTSLNEAVELKNTGKPASASSAKFERSAAFQQWPIPLDPKNNYEGVPTSRLTREDLEKQMEKNEKKFLTKAEILELGNHEKNLKDCSDKIKNNTYSIRELAYCKQFKPKLAFNLLSKSDLIIFMHFYCETRFLYPDATCDLYKKMGCHVGTNFNKIVSLRMRQLFSKNRTVFNQRVKKNQDIINKKMIFRPYCQKLAFERYVMMFTGKTCVITKGTYMSQLALGNRASNPKPSSWYHYCNIATVVTFWLLIQLWVIYCRTILKHYNAENDTPNDFALEVSGLPTGLTDRHLDMNEEISKMFKGYNLKTGGISMVYDTTEYDDLRVTLDEKRTELAKLSYKMKNNLLKLEEPGCVGKCFGAKSDLAKIKSLEQEIISNKHKCDDFEKLFDSGNAGDLFLGHAIVSFEKEDERNKAFEKFPVDTGCSITGCFQKRDSLELNIKGTKYTSLKVKECPAPLDVLYTNQKYGCTSKTIRYLVSQVVLLAAFTGCFYGVFIVFMLGQNIKNYQQEYHIVYSFLSWGWIETKISTIAVSVGIVIFNIILDIVVGIVYGMRKMNYNTDVQAGIAATSFKVQQLNTALCPIISSFISMNYLGSTGQITQVNAIFFANLVLSNVLSFFNFGWYIKCGFQWQFTKAVKSNDKSYLALFTQKEVNELFERKEFDMASKFATFFRNLGMAMLFLPILPMGVFYSVGAVVIEYWISKWVVLRRSSSNFTFGGEIAEKMKIEFDFCLICFALGLGVKEAVLNILNSQPIWIEDITAALLLASILNWLGLTNFFVNRLYVCCNKTWSKCLGVKDEVANCNTTWSTEHLKWDSTYRLENPALRVNERHKKASRLQENPHGSQLEWGYEKKSSILFEQQPNLSQNFLQRYKI